MELNVITPVSRPANLPKIRDSIVASLKDVTDWNVVWIVVFDSDRIPPEPVLSSSDRLSIVTLSFASNKEGNCVSRHGNMQRNFGLDRASSGWVLFLDDDTIIHPNLFTHISSECLKNPKISVVVDQTLPNGSPRLRAAPENMQVGSVDSGQVVFCRELIAETRWPPMEYQADGYFIVNIFRKDPTSFAFINVGVSLYNYLRP